MKRAIKIFAIAAVLLFAGIQLVRPDRTNPPVDPAATLERSTALPDDVSAILRRSCYDCHSNETVYPWYSNVAPFSWFLAWHISDGRAELNFSEWNFYSNDRRIHKLDETCDQVRSGEMPLPSYLWIHRDAVLSQGDIETLCSWAEAERSRLEEQE